MNNHIEGKTKSNYLWWWVSVSGLLFVCSSIIVGVLWNGFHGENWKQVVVIAVLTIYGVMYKYVAGKYGPNK